MNTQNPLRRNNLPLGGRQRDQMTRLTLLSIIAGVAPALIFFADYWHHIFKNFPPAMHYSPSFISGLSTILFPIGLLIGVFALFEAKQKQIPLVLSIVGLVLNGGGIFFALLFYWLFSQL